MARRRSSLVETLAKAAVGIAIAKGVNEFAKKRAGQGSIFDGLNRAGTDTAGAPGGLGGALGQILAGKGGGTAAGGLGGLLESLSGASRPTAATPPAKGSLGDLLNQSFGGYGEPPAPPPPAVEEQAALLLKAMIMAAKADGRIDPAEQKRLFDHVKDSSSEDMAFIEEQLRAPVDPRALAAEAPAGKKAQVYLISLMAIDLDSAAETRYLHDLATALGLEPATVAAIHERLGVSAPA